MCITNVSPDFTVLTIEPHVWFLCNEQHRTARAQDHAGIRSEKKNSNATLKMKRRNENFWEVTSRTSQVFSQCWRKKPCRYFWKCIVSTGSTETSFNDWPSGKWCMAQHWTFGKLRDQLFGSSSKTRSILLALLRDRVQNKCYMTRSYMKIFVVLRSLLDVFLAGQRQRNTTFSLYTWVVSFKCKYSTVFAFSSVVWKTYGVIFQRYALCSKIYTDGAPKRYIFDPLFLCRVTQACFLWELVI